MIKKQRVTKYISILSVSLGIIIATLFSNTREIKAYTNNTSAVTIESHMGEITTTHIEVVITMNFADYYSGYVTFTIYNRSSQPVSYYAINTKLTNMTNTGFRTEINQTKYAEVHIFYETASLQQACYNAGLIASNTFGLFTTYLNTNWKSTTDVKNSTWSSSTLYVDNPVDDMLSEVTSIDTNITDIENYVNSINNSVSNIATDIDTINTEISTLLTTAQSYQTYDIPLYMYPAVLLFDRSYDLQYNNNWSLPTFNCSANSSYTTSMYFKIYPNTTKYFVFYMKDTKRSTYGYVNNNNAEFTWTKHVVSVTSTYNLYYDEIYTETNSNYTPTNTVDYDIMPIFIGTLEEMPDEVRTLIGLDTATVTAIEDSTTSINSSINSTKTTLNNSIVSAKNAIVNALQNLNITVENNTEINNVVNNKDTTINNITNEHNTVNNITNDFTVNFTTADNAITFDSDIISSLTDTATFWNGKMSEVDVSLGNLHYPIVLGFILLALLAFIGG